MPFSHPESGEVLSSREDFEGALEELDARLSHIYRILRPIRVEWAVRFEPPKQPAPRYRTVTQEKVARCPRCGGSLESEGAAPK